MQSATPVPEVNRHRGNNWGIGVGIAAAIILFLLVLAQMGIFQMVFAGSTVNDGFTLITADFEFREETLRVKAGATTTLYLSNQDLLNHAFDVDELGIHVPVSANEVAPITFIVNEPGRYTFYCGVAGHRAAGMVGTLIVEE